jgi:hypothetical protein
LWGSIAPREPAVGESRAESRLIHDVDANCAAMPPAGEERPPAQPGRKASAPAPQIVKYLRSTYLIQERRKASTSCLPKILEAMMPGRPRSDRKVPAAIKARTTIGQIISALDDRNVLRALRLLEPAGEGSDPSLSPDQQDGPRCTTCVTRGE